HILYLALKHGLAIPSDKNTPRFLHEKKHLYVIIYYTETLIRGSTLFKETTNNLFPLSWVTGKPRRYILIFHNGTLRCMFKNVAYNDSQPMMVFSFFILNKRTVFYFSSSTYHILDVYLLLNISW